jgi:hypothetical protein
MTEVMIINKVIEWIIEVMILNVVRARVPEYASGALLNIQQVHRKSTG